MTGVLYTLFELFLFFYIGERLLIFVARGVVSKMIFLLPMHANGVIMFSIVVRLRLNE